MAQQIRKKFIGDDQVDGSKIKLEQGQSIRIIDSNDEVIDLVKLGESNEVLVKGEEVALKSSLDEEITRAEAAESKLSQDIFTEQIRAEAAESKISQDIFTETELREQADQNLQDNIDNLSNSVFDALDQEALDRQVAISAEQIRAEAAEAGLQSQINNILSNVDPEALDSLTEIVEAFQSADFNLQEAILALGTSAQSALAEEITRATEAEAYLQSQITQEVLDRQAAVSAEQARAEAAEAILQLNIDSEEAARIAADTDLSNRIQPIEDLLDFEKVVVYENNAQVYADAQPGVEDSNLRPGWYYENLSTGQKINWYFFDGINQSNIAKSDFSAYAVVTFDSIASLPILAVYTVATGTNDVMPGFAHSRYIYSNFSATPTVGKKYLIFIGEDPAIHPELPRIQVNLTNSQGDQDPTERVLTVSFGTNSAAAVGNVKLVAEHLGVSSPSFKGNAELKIRTTSISKFEGEKFRAQAAEAELQSKIDTEKNRIDAILLASDADKDSFAEIVSLINSVDTENDSAFASYVLSNDAALAQEISDRQFADNELSNSISSLQSQVDDIDVFSQINRSNLEQEISDRISADSLITSRIEVLESKGFSKGVVIVGEELSFIDLDREYSVLLSVAVGRLMIHEGEDFTVSVVEGKTRLTWIGSLVNPGGEEAIETNDKIFFSGAF